MEGLARLERPLGRLLERVDFLLALVTGLALAFVVGANAWEIVLRAVANRSLIWLYEVNLLLANWIYFFGICLVYHRRRDIVVDFLVQALPPGPRRLYQTLINLLVVVILVVIAWYGALLMQLQIPDRTMGIGIWNPLFTLPVVAGAVVMLLTVLHHTLVLWLEREPA